MQDAPGPDFATSAASASCLPTSPPKRHKWKGRCVWSAGAATAPVGNLVHVGKEVLAETQPEASLLQQRTDQAICRQHEGERQLIRRPGGDRPKGERESDIDRLPNDAEQSGCRHRRKNRRPPIGDSPPTEKSGLQRNPGVPDGLEQQEPRGEIEAAQEPKHRSFSVPPDDATWGPQSKQQENLYRRHDRVGGGRQARTNSRRRKSGVRRVAPNGDRRSECRKGNCASNRALTSALQGAGTWPKERLIPKNMAMIIVATATLKST